MHPRAVHWFLALVMLVVLRTVVPWIAIFY
jgi:hypothetical protein